MLEEKFTSEVIHYTLIPADEFCTMSQSEVDIYLAKNDLSMHKRCTTILMPEHLTLDELRKRGSVYHLDKRGLWLPFSSEVRFWNAEQGNFARVIATDFVFSRHELQNGSRETLYGIQVYYSEIHGDE